jgi:hypothetical protein
LNEYDSRIDASSTAGEKPVPKRDFGCHFYDKFFFYFTLDDLHFVRFFSFLFTSLVQLDFDALRRLFRRTTFISSLCRSKMT